MSGFPFVSSAAAGGGLEDRRTQGPDVDVDVRRRSSTACKVGPPAANTVGDGERRRPDRFEGDPGGGLEDVQGGELGGFGAVDGDRSRTLRRRSFADPTAASRTATTIQHGGDGEFVGRVGVNRTSAGRPSGVEGGDEGGVDGGTDVGRGRSPDRPRRDATAPVSASYRSSGVVRDPGRRRRRRRPGPGRVGLAVLEPVDVGRRRRQRRATGDAGTAAPAASGRRRRRIGGQTVVDQFTGGRRTVRDIGRVRVIGGQA